MHIQPYGRQATRIVCKQWGTRQNYAAREAFRRMSQRERLARTLTHFPLPSAIEARGVHSSVWGKVPKRHDLRCKSYQSPEAAADPIMHTYNTYMHNEAHTDPLIFPNSKSFGVFSRNKDAAPPPPHTHTTHLDPIMLDIRKASSGRGRGGRGRGNGGRREFARWSLSCLWPLEGRASSELYSDVPWQVWLRGARLINCLQLRAAQARLSRDPVYHIVKPKHEQCYRLAVKLHTKPKGIWFARFGVPSHALATHPKTASS